MKLRVAGKSIPCGVLAELGRLTNMAYFSPNGLKFDETTGSFSAEMMRCLEIKASGLRGLLGRMTIDPSSRVPCLVTVNNVLRCKIDDASPNSVERVSCLFGIRASESGVSFTSAEENHGVPLIVVQLRVSELDIELADFEPAHN